MPRRCLDCDHIYAALRSCPRCGSTKQLYLDVTSDEKDPIFHNAWLALGNAVMMTGATLGKPGLGLGSALFAQAFCAVLILLGTERAQRAMAPLWFLTGFIEISYACVTDQTAFAMLAAVASACGFIHALPWQSLVSTGGLVLSWTASVCLVVGLVFHAFGAPPPGWWQGQHPEVLKAGKTAAKVLTAPPGALPEVEPP